MIDRTENSKIPANNKNDLWSAAVAFSSDCSKIPANPDFVKTFFRLIYTNVTIRYFFISARKMCQNVFQGYHGKGKVREIRTFFKISEKSGNF